MDELIITMRASRAAYAAWWEAYELSGAELTEQAIRQAGHADGDRDDTTSDPGERDIAMESDEALAVLRLAASGEDESEAVRQVTGELVTLRTQRRAVLDLAGELEREAWDRGGDQTVRAAVRQLREALGAGR